MITASLEPLAVRSATSCSASARCCAATAAACACLRSDLSIAEPVSPPATAPRAPPIRAPAPAWPREPPTRAPAAEPSPAPARTPLSVLLIDWQPAPKTGSTAARNISPPALRFPIVPVISLPPTSHPRPAFRRGGVTRSARGVNRGRSRTVALLHRQGQERNLRREGKKSRAAMWASPPGLRILRVRSLLAGRLLRLG